MRKLERDLLSLYKDIYCFVNSRINNSEYAKDITQSVMQTAIEKYETLRNKAALKSWLMQIANNRVNAYYNDLKKINSVFVYQGDNDDNENQLDIYNIADIKSDILELIISEEDKKNVILALNRLEFKYQEVIRLNYICGYSFIEISEILNTNVNTVRTWGARGIVKLKIEFDKINAGGENEAI